MKIIYLFLSVTLLFSCCESNYSAKELSHLDMTIEKRVSLLNDNYKYQALSYYEHLPKFDSLLISLKQFHKNDDWVLLKDEIDRLSKILGIEAKDIDQKTFQKDVRVATILILDELIMRTLDHSSAFSSLQPMAFLERGTDSIDYFQIVLHASDTLFLPEVVLELPTGSFLVMVDPESGIAHFSMEKKNPNEIKEFEGKIYYGPTDNRREIGRFSYPRKLISKKY